MRRSLATLLAAPAIALAIGLAAAPANAGDTIHTPIPRGPGNLVATPCPTYYKLVTLTITDNGVLANGAAAPKCLRLSTGGTLKIVNNAESEATVTFDGDTNMMVIGELWNYAPIGAFYSAGTNLTFSVGELAGSSMSIQVF
jgi:hypothetical protein